MVARIASRRVLQASRARQQTRQLSIIPNAAAHQPRYLDVQKEPPKEIPNDVSKLQKECKDQNVSTSGNRAELVGRLTNIALRRSRAFTTAASAHIKSKRRPSSYTAETPPAIQLSTTPPPPKAVRRHLNTSRALKRQNDTSTIDFAFLPTFPLPSRDLVDTDIVQAQIPILPHNENPRVVQEESGGDAPGLPTILTLAGPETHPDAPSRMQEVHDNNAAAEHYANITGGALESAVYRTGDELLHKANDEIAKIKEGVVGQVWKGFLDDVFGPKKGPKDS